MRAFPEWIYERRPTCPDHGDTMTRYCTKQRIRYFKCKVSGCKCTRKVLKWVPEEDKPTR